MATSIAPGLNSRSTNTVPPKARAGTTPPSSQEDDEFTPTAAVGAEHPREEGEDEVQWQARIKPEQDRRKLEEIGRLPAPPKYISADFLKSTYWRLRGGLACVSGLAGVGDLRSAGGREGARKASEARWQPGLSAFAALGPHHLLYP